MNLPSGLVDYGSADPEARNELQKMECDMWLDKIIPLLSIAFILVGESGHAASAEATPVAGDTNLELPAMILTPNDLGFAGMAAYPIDHVEGALQTPQKIADEFVGAEGVSAERAKAVFIDTGVQQRYWHQYVLRYPSDPVQAVLVARRASTSVYEFKDAAAAETAFKPLSRLLAWDAPAISSGTTAVGDQSRLSRAEVPFENIEGTYPELTLTFQTGRLIASVSISDDQGEPDVGALETLATRFLDQIASVSSTGGPSESDLVMRFSDEDVLSGNYDGYSLLGGNVVVRSGETTNIYTPLEATAAAGVGALDGCKLSYLLMADVGAWVADFGTLIYRFNDATEASDWLQSLPDRLATTSARNLEITGIPELGEDAFVASHESSADQSVPNRQVAVVRSGAQVAILYGPSMDAETTNTFMEAQVACISKNGCVDLPSQKSGVRENWLVA